MLQVGVDDLITLDLGIYGVPLYADRVQPQGAPGLVDWLLGGAIARLRAEDRFQGQADERLLFTRPRRTGKAMTVLLLGLGPPDANSPPKLAPLLESLGTLGTAAGRRVGLCLPEPRPLAADPALIESEWRASVGDRPGLMLLAPRPRAE